MNTFHKVITKASLITLLLGSWLAHASLLLEPGLGYQASTLKLETAAGDSGGKMSGVNLTARVGYVSMLGLWVAADGNFMSGATFDGSSSVNDGKVDATNIYADVGFNFPILLRAWFGYGLSNTAKLKLDTGGDTTLKEGTNMKFGVGLRLIPLVSLNLEYIMHDYKKFDGLGLSGNTSDLWTTHTNRGVLLSVSLPLEL
jgi:hypothetical protein